jgi:hypothetical protein
MIKALPRLPPPLRLLLVVLVVVLIPQLVIPRIAEHVLRNRLGPTARIETVKVEAFPAIELIWHRAQKVVVKLASYRAPLSKIRQLIDEASGVTTVEATIGRLTSGALTLHNLRFAKQHNRISGAAVIRLADLRSSLPILKSLTPVDSSDGELTLRGTAGLLGLKTSVDAVVEAKDGAVVVAPKLPLLGFATINVFSAPHLDIQRVSGRSVPGGVLVRITGVWK